MRVAFVVPAYQSESMISGVVSALSREARTLPSTTDPPVLVVDDGCTDATAACARAGGALVLQHPENRGKGAALLTGLLHAEALGAEAAVTVDADGQHPANEALRLAACDAPASALVLGVRDLVRDGAPRASQFSNRFSNLWMSWFARRKLNDTQCGLRRYPLPRTLELGLRGSGYELESEVILRAIRSGIELVELPVRVVYPDASQRISHFHPVRDPTRIVLRLLHTAVTAPRRRA